MKTYRIARDVQTLDVRQEELHPLLTDMFLEVLLSKLIRRNMYVLHYTGIESLTL